MKEKRVVVIVKMHTYNIYHTKIILFVFFDASARKGTRNSITPVDICCRRHVRAVSQKHFRRNVHTIYVSIIEVVTDSSKVLLPVECKPVILKT